MTLYRIRLSNEERSILEGLVRKRISHSQSYKYAQILLHSDESVHSKAQSAAFLSRQYGISEKTVERVRRSFCTEGMGIFEAKARRPRSDKKFDARVEAHLIALCCQAPPNGSPRWELRMLADRLVELEVVDAISTSSVCNLLKKTNLSLSEKNNT